MPRFTLRQLAAAAVWLSVVALGCLVLARGELARLREAFETDARIVHRLLSQRAVQHEAVLATLALLQPADGAGQPEQRLPSVYPQILGVERRAAGATWGEPRLQAAEALSRTRRRPVLAHADLAASRYQLLLAAEPASFALKMDVRAAVPWAEWPMAADGSPVRVALEYGGQRFEMQPGRIGDGGWRFEFRKQLAADSQPFDVVAARQVGWDELPWAWMGAWCVAVTLAAAALLALARQRGARRRAEELVRLGRVGRLNALGELAAGMAHELNQPLTAVLANNQAARRLLQEDPPDLATARTALDQAVEQSRRATEVIGRLRRAVERPGVSGQMQPVPLQEAMQNVLHLLAPELKRCGLAPRLVAADPGAVVMADPVALEQIIYNLVTNALQALEQVPPGQRELTAELSRGAQTGVLTLSDTGPGIPADVLPRVFEPFFSTRANGLGLGLSLCETLAQGMGGALSAARREPRGAQFRLSLPLAPA